MSHVLEQHVLMLNNNYIPLTTCSAKRAIIMVWTGKAEMVESSGYYVRSVSMTIDIPSIIRLLVIVRMSQRMNIQLTKQNILKRDRKTCQYCGRTEGHMTVDHVIPRSLGGTESWENLVCACSSCNNIKGDRTPNEAGMSLVRRPHKPSLFSFLFHSKTSLQTSWQIYLKIR